MLILRLRHNVIKTGLRAIALSYSRISLADVAAKLTLGSREDAEFIVAKAIRDGVIEVSCGVVLLNTVVFVSFQLLDFF